MNKLTKHTGTVKVTYLFTTGLLLFLALLFTPEMPAFERVGDNYFTISLNGTPIGAVADFAQAEELVQDVRRQIAKESGEMVYIPTDLTAEGKEVLFAQVDRPEDMEEKIRKVMENSVLKTLQHAYTVKINEYTVNLASSDQVLALLQATLDQYDTKGEYQVELVVDPDRELSVLTTQISRRDQVEKNPETVHEGAGIRTYFDELFLEIEPDMEKSDFSNLDYGLVELEFGDVVEVVDAYLMANEISSLEDAIAEVTAAQAKKQIYEVKPGDTLSQIAEEKGFTIEELVAINPMLEDENSMIRVGDELTITVPEPALSVIHKELIYEEDSYEEEVVYIDNDSWYTNESKVRQQPSAGYRKAAALVTYRNDSAVAEEIVKEDVEYQAVPKVVERGTKVPPTFIRPISGGRTTSAYGRRSAPTKGASTNHKGIDWAIPTGTAVMASSGGTVTRAGWASGYGYVVYIQHEGGRETRYGHLSKVLVSAGQKVKQGQKIALSGNTGRSTGPHLHFELRINGQAVNPNNYF